MVSLTVNVNIIFTYSLIYSLLYHYYGRKEGERKEGWKNILCFGHFLMTLFVSEAISLCELAGKVVESSSIQLFFCLIHIMSKEFISSDI